MIGRHNKRWSLKETISLKNLCKFIDLQLDMKAHVSHKQSVASWTDVQA